MAAAEGGGAGAGGAEAELAALEARRAALRRELERRNVVVKSAIDRLRVMLDALQLFRAEASA